MCAKARNQKSKRLFLKLLKLKQFKPLKKLSLKQTAKRFFILQALIYRLLKISIIYPFIDNKVCFKMAALDEEEANLIQIAMDIQYRQRQQLATDSCTSK